MDERHQERQSGDTGDRAAEVCCAKEKPYIIKLCSGDSFSSFEIEATELGIEIESAVIEWGWILRQLARLEDNRLKY